MGTKYRSVSSLRRELVWAKGKGHCHWCGTALARVRPKNGIGWQPEEVPDNLFTVDHVIARSLGGKDDLDNLVAACHKCNCDERSKKQKTPQEHRHFLGSILGPALEKKNGRL